MSLRPAVMLSLLAVLAVASACSSTADSVCENVVACENGGSSEQVQSCQDEAKLLKSEAQASGCGGAYHDYYTCADEHFMCNGATASFPGCDGYRITLDTCLGRSSSQNACGELQRKTAICHTTDAGSLTPEAACTAERACAARCYLDSVLDPCAPRPDELTSAASCSIACPR